MNKRPVLIIDDDRTIAESLAMHLEYAGYKTRIGFNGQQCLQYLQEDKPVLVLLDIIMPREDGIEVLKKIKRVDPAIPVIMITGVYDNNEGIRAFDAGAIDYVTKPIDLPYLLNVVSLQTL